MIEAYWWRGGGVIRASTVLSEARMNSNEIMLPTLTPLAFIKVTNPALMLNIFLPLSVIVTGHFLPSPSDKSILIPFVIPVVRANFFGMSYVVGKYYYDFKSCQM